MSASPAKMSAAWISNDERNKQECAAQLIETRMRMLVRLDVLGKFSAGRVVVVKPTETFGEFMFGHVVRFTQDVENEIVVLVDLQNGDRAMYHPNDLIVD